MMRQIRVIKNTNTPQAANATFAETNHCRRRYPCRRRQAVANSSATIAVSTIAGHTTKPLPISAVIIIAAVTVTAFTTVLPIGAATNTAATNLLLPSRSYHLLPLRG